MSEVGRLTFHSKKDSPQDAMLDWAFQSSTGQRHFPYAEIKKSTAKRVKMTV